MLCTLREVSPFQGYYLCNFMVVLISCVYSLVFDVNHLGVFPMTKSMTFFNGYIRFIYDVLAVVYIQVYCVILFRYVFFGISPKTKLMFKKHEEILLKTNPEYSYIYRKTKIILIISTLFIVSLFLIYACLFWSSVHASSVLILSLFFIFLSSIFVILISSIVALERVKYVL